MPLFAKSRQDLVSDGLRKLRDNTNITQMSPGGKARFLIQTTAEDQARSEATFDLNILQAYIQYSESKFLDFFGDMLDLPRLEATHAEATDENFLFYVDNGTFGTLNNNITFTIPSGTIVSTVPYSGETVTPGIEEQPVIQYTTIANAVCEPDSSFVFVSIRASAEGKAYSVPKNILKKHNFGSYSLNSSGRLKCTNRYAIDNGDERESDASYRYRLLQVFKSKERATRAAIRLAALSVPGVSNITLINAEQGPGTYGLYITGLTPTVSPKLLINVTTAVSLVSADGIRPYVSAPTTLGMEFVVGINWNPRINAEQKAKEYKSIRTNMENYLNQREIGEEIVLSDLISVILSSGPNVFSVGKNKPNEFEEVYIYRSAPSGVGSIRTKLTSSLVEPLYNERIILETSNNYRGIQFI